MRRRQIRVGRGPDSVPSGRGRSARGSSGWPRDRAADGGRLLGSIPVALIYSFFVKYYVAGLTAGAVKGW